MERFTFFDHEADIGVEVYGKSIEELFKNAALALFSIMIEEKEKRPEGIERKEIEIEKDGEVLISFLNELLFLWETEGFFVTDLSMRIDEERLRATLFGKRFDPSSHVLKKEVKAATYHNFELKKKEDLFIARLVFDI